MISTTTTQVSYTANGATTAFAFAYLFYANSHLVVQVTDLSGVTTTMVLGTDYNVSGAGVGGGGTVTFVVAPTNLYVVTITRVVPLTQLTQYINSDLFPAATHEQTLDKIFMALQQMNFNLTTLMAGATVRVQLGKLQIKNDTDSLWYTVGVESVGGIPSLYLLDTGSA